ncbi:Nucleoside-diphosphate-sugar epimerase [Streptomyces sp. 2131.1]|uniref:SDR family oxidoreductase n=1 Tax=Streptomyces sp. 2131.1 TaxID=1855346 RepID=UPI000894D5BE|nr:SDR family oxidoreductase [Streptomyces sp. 2131.1]SEC65431.1 Nucleoside-diphosphate-sugar epimerase [Streptomyces sp. 2131.1]
MRVFITGASGWIGSAVIPELIEAGHQVVGLARSEASAEALATAGAEVRRGSLDDLDVLREAAADADGVLHLAFKHDIAFSGDFQGATDADRRAIDAFGDALAGSGKPFVIASGLLGLAPGRVATEEDGQSADPRASAGGPGGRQENARATLALASRGVRSSVVRLPPTVHGDGDQGFVASLIANARDKGVSGYVGDGSGRWPAAHRSDVAHLFRLALENAPAGTTLHAAAEEGVGLRSVAETIGRHLGIPVVSVAPEDAAGHFGWLGAVVSLDSPASSALTRERFGWKPAGPGLVEDLDQGHYFRAPAK